jgi:hypothetical protein
MKISLWNGALYLQLHEAWIRYYPPELERLATLFRADKDPASQELADRLDAALRAYNAERQDAA